MIRRIAVLILATALSFACGGDGREPQGEPGVSNESLQLRLTEVPSEFVVTVNEGDRFELAPASESIQGRVWFELGDEERGVNLIAAVKRHQRQIEESPGADYRGGQELGTPLGVAFYSRGRFLAGTTETEETAVFVQHPTQSRLLSITYRYPAGVDSSVRVQQLLDVLAVLDGTHTGAE